MGGSGDWRNSLTASDRYDTIQAIKQAIQQSRAGATQKSAIAIENEAYTSSATREVYEAACRSLNRDSSPEDFSQAPTPCQVAALQDDINEESPGSPGIRIGSYQSCHYVASGVTAEVYRCRSRALKVIIETRDIEPHNPFREAKILHTLKQPCISLLETFRDQEQRFVLVFPYMPLTLGALLDTTSLSDSQIRSIFKDVFNALDHIHSQGIIHRDIKPAAILLASPHGPAYLSDFGTAWHPALSAATEPADRKILDIGTGPYRAPEALFGNKSYGPPIDMWGAGAMLAECCRRPPKSLFESRPVHEDGNQLGLILSIFKTIGSPTRETWPEAVTFKTPPFEMYRTFDHRNWEDILPEVDPPWRKLIEALVKYDSSRATARQALDFGSVMSDTKE